MRLIDTLAKKGDAMMANSIRARKGILRDRCRDLRKEMDMDYLRDASDAITKHILASEAYRDAGTIFVYMSYGKEVITDGFIAQALADGKKICIPLCLPENQMEAKCYTGPEDLHSGKYGIREPREDAETVAREEIDLALIPCVACDKRCNRLGHGAGYYDRYLEGTDFVKMALCPEKMILSNVAVDALDVPMDAVVTEEGIVTRNR